MKRGVKNFICYLIVICTLMIAPGCGKGETDKDYTQDIIAKTRENIESLEEIKAKGVTDITFKINVSVASLKLTMEIKEDYKYNADPMEVYSRIGYKTSTEVNVSGLEKEDEVSNEEVYILYEDGENKEYKCIDGEWEECEAESEHIDEFAKIKSTLTKLMSTEAGLKYQQYEMIDNVKAIKLSKDLQLKDYISIYGSEKIKEVVSEFIEGVMGTDDIFTSTDDFCEEFIEKNSDIPISVSVWIDTENCYPIKTSMDETEFINQIIESIDIETYLEKSEDFEGFDVDCSFKDCITEINYSSFNGVDKMHLPEDVQRSLDK